MAATAPPVSIGIPLRNGQHLIDSVLGSVLAQTYADIEVILSDNASDDATEEIAREYARKDPRIRYFRQPTNLGVHGNFIFVRDAAAGEFFKWVGGDDRLEQNYVERCLPALQDDPRLVVVTSQVSFTQRDGTKGTARYTGSALRSDDAAERFGEMLRLLNKSHRLIDPMYGLVRRQRVADLPLAARLRGDQVWAARLALAGPWAHINEVLAHRGWPDDTRAVLARRIGVPAWHARTASAMQARELLGVVAHAELTSAQRRAARQAVAKWYVGWHRRRALRAGRRLLGTATSHVRRTR